MIETSLLVIIKLLFVGLVTMTIINVALIIALSVLLHKQH